LHASLAKIFTSFAAKHRGIKANVLHASRANFLLAWLQNTGPNRVVLNQLVD
jgi:hypothetical protein